MRVLHITIFLIIILLLPSTNPVFSEDKPSSEVFQSHKNFQGVASCASSNCHGGINPKKNQKILLNEYTTWFRYDKHSQAYKTLLSPSSKRIARNLNIQSPETSPTCLNCHTTFSADKTAINNPKYRIVDGVSCESCHGSAQRWLKSHPESGSSHNNNVADGLVDLRLPEVKAKVCTACHIGNVQKEITHQIYGAGHPKLTFELDTFTALMPSHWEKNINYDPVSTWLIGLAVQASARLSNINQKTFSHWIPELSNFSCTTCHHSLGKKEFEKRNYQGKAGELKLNLSALTVLAEAINVLDSPKNLALSSEKIKGIIELLNNTTDKDKLVAEAKSSVEYLDKVLVPEVKQVRTTSQANYNIFEKLEKLYNPKADYETAEQVAIGMAVISSAEGDPSDLKTKVDKLYGLLSKNELP